MSGHKSFDINTATPAEVRAERDRRQRNVAAGRNPTDDGQGTTDAIARGVVRDPGSLIPERPPLQSRHFTLPWSVLVADNAKYAPGVRRTPAGPQGVILLTPAYRVAKKKAEALVREQLVAQGSPPLITGSILLMAELIEPDTRTRRDIANYAKLVHDVLTGLAYRDDHQLDEVRWIRMPHDIDRPRLEITLQEVRHG